MSSPLPKPISPLARPQSLHVVGEQQQTKENGGVEWQRKIGPLHDLHVLPNGNVLICETSKGQFFEVTRRKQVVWEYINPFYVYNPRLGGRMNMVFRCHRYGPNYAGLNGRDLDPARYANLNRLYEGL